MIQLQKFLHTGQRGALVASAEIQHTSAPGVIQPVFDWITLQDARPTWDRVLQESIICHNPEKQVVVFVFLLSKTGGSMAMWRRKCPVPEAVRHANKTAIHQTIARLNEEEVVYVDECVAVRVIVYLASLTNHGASADCSRSRCLLLRRAGGC